jgi:hypothetical protein
MLQRLHIDLQGTQLQAVALQSQLSHQWFVCLQIVEGEWFDDPSKPHNRRHKTQNQEMLGYYLGVWGVRTVAFMQFFGWFGEWPGGKA